MKRVLLLTCLSALCFGQQVTRGIWQVLASEQTNEGHVYHLKGHAELRGASTVFRADEIDYDEIKFTVHLAGHVTIETDSILVRGEELDYDINSGDVRARRGDVNLKLKQSPAR
jgi:lipopolysaccharide assembly outer membrane protein LptD (OstA)